MAITKQAGQFLVVARGLKANLESVAKTAGQMLVTTDERAVYFDLDASTRIRIGDYQVVDCVDTNDATYGSGKSVLPSAASVGTELYFVKSMNALVFSNGTSWVQVSTDTGATSVVFTGGSGVAQAPTTGEYVSGVSYDPNTRALTFAVTKLIAQNVEYTAASGTPGQDGYKSAVSVKNALDMITGDNNVEGSIKKAVKDAVESLDTQSDVTIATESAGVVTLTKSINETDGIVGAVTGAGSTITLAKVATTGEAGDVDVTAIAGVTGSNVQSVLEDLKTQTDKKTIYLVDNSANQVDYAKVYKLYQGKDGNVSSPDNDELIGTINIPLDKVVRSGNIDTIIFNNNKLYDASYVTNAYVVGSTPLANDWLSLTNGGTAFIPESSKVYKVVTAGTYENKMYVWTGSGYSETTAGADVTTLIKGTDTPTIADAGKYIRLELQNVDDPLFIYVKDLVDIYNGSTNAEATVTVDNNNQISITINKIDASKIDYTSSETVSQALTRLDGSDSTTGSVAKKIKDAIDGLDTSSDVVIATESNDVVTLKAGVKEVDGVISQSTGSDIVLAKAAKTGAATDISITDAGGFTNTTNVESAIQEIYGQITWGTF